MKVIRLPRTKVHLGEPLPWNVRDEQGKLLLSKGFVVNTEHQLDQLLQRGAFVDIEEAKLYQQGVAPPPEEKKMVVPPNLFGLWGKTAEELRILLSHPEGKSDFLPQLNAFALHILKLLDCNLDVGIFRAVRQENQQHFYYGYTHSIHTAVLCVLLSRHLQWPQERLMSLMKAALTMNLSILELQGQMAAQDVSVKDRQRAEIGAHPEKTVALLKTLGVTDADWLETILQHHEHVDGTGYPSHSTNVSELAIALRVCDVLMAKISPRALRAALPPQDAIRQMYREDKGGPISTGIIKEFGLYPPGDFVKLVSGELGIVVQRTANTKAPVVAAITDTNGRPVTSTIRRDTAQAGYAIAGAHSDSTMLKRLPPERLYGFSASNLAH